MSRTGFPVAVAVIATLLLNGCGAGQSGQPVPQDKQASRSVKQANSPYAQVVQELYVAYFGRPADPAGLANFENALAAANAPKDMASLTQAYSANKAVQALIDSFGTSKESQTLYGSGSTQDFVTAVFNNVLGRAPQQTGLDYWASAIDGGSLSKGDAALAIMAGALSNTTAQGHADAQLIGNRLSVAAGFTTQLTSQDAVAAYSGASAAASARGMLAKVNAGTDLNGFSDTVTTTILGLLQASPGITLVAGNPTAGIPVVGPAGMARDSRGNLYMTDVVDNVVVKVTPDGTGSVLAGSSGTTGSADGSGGTARFNQPMGLAIDSADNIYVADFGNSTIRKITPAGVVTTFAGMTGLFGVVDGAGQNARFSRPYGMAIDSYGTLYVSDNGYGSNTIRKITPGGMVTTFAGASGSCGSADGPAASARFCSPAGLTMDAGGNLYIVDAGNYTIRKLSTAGMVTTVAGVAGVAGRSDGPAAQAHFSCPGWLASDNTGNLFVAEGYCDDAQFPLIRKITPQGAVSTLAGGSIEGFQDGTGAAASFGSPAGMIADGAGNLLVADTLDAAIRQISPSGQVSTLASAYGSVGNTDALGAAAQFGDPLGIAADKSGNLYIGDNLNKTLRRISPSGSVSTVAGGSTQCDIFDPQDGTGAGACFGSLFGMTIDARGNLYVADPAGEKIRIVSPAGVVTTLFDLRNLPYSFGMFSAPTGIAMDMSGNVYSTDEDFQLVVKISPAGAVTTLAGSAARPGSADGPGTSAAFNIPMGIAVDGAGNSYVADNGNQTIRKIAPDGTTSTLAGTAGAAGFADGMGATARFRDPTGVALDSAGNLYVADTGNNAIRKITPAGVVTTVAGSASTASIVRGALPGGLYRPRYLTVVGANTLFVTSAGAVLRVQLP